MKSVYDISVYGILIPLTIVLAFVFEFLVIQKRNRKHSILLFVLTVCSYSVTYTAIYALCDQQSGTFIFLVLCISSQISNVLSTLVLMIYLNYQEETFKVSGYMGVIAIIFIPLSIYFLRFLFFLNFGYIYSLLLGNVIKQIMDGRFKLKKNQIVAGALVASYGICIPCKEND